MDRLAPPAPASALGSRLGTPRALLRFAWLSLLLNATLVVTGALVRLTKSGLGCPTWPRCTDDSYVSTPEMGIHGVIEFGNRLLTFVLLASALLTLLSAWLQRRAGADGDTGRLRIKVIALIMALGIPLQGVIGGITVLTQLNPFVVALHLLLSFALICLGVALVRLAGHAPRRIVARRDRAAARVLFVAAWLAAWLGTVVTGSGPHSGDSGAARTGFDIELTAKVHAVSVWLLVLLTGYLLFRLRSRAVAWLLAAELAQGLVGYLQYFLGVPIGLVIVHMLGSALVMALAANLALSLTTRPEAEHRVLSPPE